MKKPPMSEPRDVLIQKVLAILPTTLHSVVKSVPRSRQVGYGKSLGEKYSRAECVKMKCLECSSWIQEEVKGCAVRTCPLWQCRPYK
jgi:hypothetical protein